MAYNHRKSAVERFFTNDLIMTYMVLVNTVVIFISGFYKNSIPMLTIDGLFTILFIFEAYVKIRYYGFKNYWRDGWNKFDFIVTALAAPSLINVFISFDLSTNAFLSMRALRAFRAFRIAKAGRLLQFLPRINEILNGIKLAFRASFFVILGFSLMLLLTSILSSEIFGDLAPDYFGNPALSLYSTFKLFTGEGWYEIPDMIAAHSTASMAVFVRIYFSLFLFFGSILGLSIVNSIFVDAMVSDNNKDVLRQLSRIESKLDEIESRMNDEQKR